MKTKILNIILLTLTLNCFSQEGKYFGEEYVCTVVSAINQYYWIDLKEDNSFEMNIFNLDEDLKCLKIKGNWNKTNDTLRLTSSENKNYYYLITTDGKLKSPNKDVFYLIMTNQEDQVVNKGIDNFGIGISEMKPVNKLLLYSGAKTKEKILKWITTHCN